MTDSYNKALEDAQAELVELTNQRADIDRRIARLKAFIAAARNVNPASFTEAVQNWLNDFVVPASLKDACVQVLHAAYKALTSSEVVYELRELGFDIDSYSNPVAVVTTTLKRLVESSEALEEDRPDGKKAYKLKPAIPSYYSSRYKIKPGGFFTKILEPPTKEKK